MLRGIVPAPPNQLALATGPYTERPVLIHPVKGPDRLILRFMAPLISLVPCLNRANSYRVRPEPVLPGKHLEVRTWRWLPSASISHVPWRSHGCPALRSERPPPGKSG